MDEITSEEAKELDEKIEADEISDSHVEDEDINNIPSFKETGIGGLYEDIKQVELKDVFNREIIIYDFKELPSQFGESFCVVLARVLQNGIERVTFPVGSKVLVRQLKESKENRSLPFKARIVEKKSKAGKDYHTFE